MCEDFNLPGVTWIRNNETTTFSGTINDKVRIIGHQYAFLNFVQNNEVRNNNGAILDLVLSNYILNIEPASDNIVPSDTHHQPLSTVLFLKICLCYETIIHIGILNRQIF